MQCYNTFKSGSGSESWTRQGASYDDKRFWPLSFLSNQTPPMFDLPTVSRGCRGSFGVGLSCAAGKNLLSR